MIADFGPALLQRAIERHGGLARWRALAAVDLQVASLSGPLLFMKGQGRTFTPPGRATIEPHRARSVWHDWPERGQRGVYQQGLVTIADERVPLGAETFPDETRRTAFTGWRKWRRWRDLDALYFFGYALVHYLSLPFCLREAEILSARRLKSGGGALWCRLPGDRHTHSAVEGYRFDASGLLTRHDYRADIISRAATGGHQSWDYREIAGWPVAHQRRVRARMGHFARAPMTPMTVLKATFADVRVRFAE